eukprot:6258844-Alexandrium_andersonii.AAC.1
MVYGTRLRGVHGPTPGPGANWGPNIPHGRAGPEPVPAAPQRTALVCGEAARGRGGGERAHGPPTPRRA